MRDLAILLIYAVGLLFTIPNPFVGLMVYTWISVMNPHRYVWGPVYTMPLAQIAALITMASMALHSEQVRYPRTRETYLFLLMWAWLGLTTLFAFYPDDAWEKLLSVTKIFIMVFVSMLLINSRARVVYFLLGLVAFVGVLGVKGAVFGALTGGRQRVWGPEESFLADNNAAALAMVMTLPFCFFLRGVVKQKWLSMVLLTVGLCSIVSILLTYSRGGLLGVVAVCLVSILFSRHKVRIGIAAVSVAVVGLSVLPPAWMGRMATIKEGGEERSASMRLNSWAMSYNLAKDNPLGGGLKCFTMKEYYLYAPDPELGRLGAGAGATAHSIYFQVLATQGFGGLALFLLCLISIQFSLNRIRRTAKAAGHADAVAISAAFTASISGYMVSGAFLSLAFFDLFWSIFGAALCFKSVFLAGDWQHDEHSMVIGPTAPPVGPVAVTRVAPRVRDLRASLKIGREL